MSKVKKIGSVSTLVFLLFCMLLCCGCSKNYVEPTDDEAISEIHSIHDAIGIQLGTEDIETITHLSLQDGILAVTVDLSRLDRDLNADEYNELIRGVDTGIKRGTRHKYYDKAMINVVGGETYYVTF